MLVWDVCIQGQKCSETSRKQLNLIYRATYRTTISGPVSKVTLLLTTYVYIKLISLLSIHHVTYS